MKPKIKQGDFLESVNQTIAEGHHVDYLREALKKYDEYKREFENSFTENNSATAVYKFRVNYLLKKPVWRDIEIIGSQLFVELAEIIIDSMSWQNDHMHAFGLPQKQERPDPFLTGSAFEFYAPGWEDDPHPTYKTDEICIHDLDYDKCPKFNFIFDFGDGHRFSVELKKIRKPNDKEDSDSFPCVIDQRGVGPEQYPEYD